MKNEIQAPSILPNNPLAGKIPAFMGEIGGKKQLVCKMRDLHSALEILKDFSDWSKYQLDEQLIENKDFALLLPQKGEQKTDGRGGHNRTDYLLTLRTARKLAMTSRSRMADAVRDYFVDMEEAALASQSAPALPNLEPVMALIQQQNSLIQQQGEMLQVLVGLVKGHDERLKVLESASPIKALPRPAIHPEFPKISAPATGLLSASALGQRLGCSEKTVLRARIQGLPVAEMRYPLGGGKPAPHFDPAQAESWFIEQHPRRRISQVLLARQQWEAEKLAADEAKWPKPIIFGPETPLKDIPSPRHTSHTDVLNFFNAFINRQPERGIKARDLYSLWDVYCRKHNLLTDNDRVRRYVINLTGVKEARMGDERYLLGLDFQHGQTLPSGVEFG